MDEATIRSFWEQYPCGDVLVGGLRGKYEGDHKRFFDEYDAFRYAMEDHIPRCLDEMIRRGIPYDTANFDPSRALS